MERQALNAFPTDTISSIDSADVSVQFDLQKAGESLLDWHAQTERDLPWRAEKDPYRIWVSETMLQQTRAAVAAQRYREFLRAFPTVHALASAPENAVLQLWQGLGYYARARNMHRAATQLVSRHGGAFPHTEEELLSLSGVGHYTACAILSMAFDVPVPAVDANLARVISRFAALYGFVEDNANTLRQIGTQWLASCALACPGDFNRALMGLGAMVCTRSPHCFKCPIAPFCRAFVLGEQEVLPQKKPKAQRKVEHRLLSLYVCSQHVIVHKRETKGMLGGLYEFPNVVLPEAQCTKENCLVQAGEIAFVPSSTPALAGESSFTFTHRVWKLHAFFCEGEVDTVPEGMELVDASALSALPMPSVMEPYRQAVLEKLL